MGDTAIIASNISKRYRIGKLQSGSFRYKSLRDSLADAAQGALARLRGEKAADSGVNEIWALKDVSFEVKKGEAVGIIGRNGAGKSTLLKVLSRITRPTSGRVELHGRVGSLLEVGTGFHPELTGRENIYLNGAILGMQRSEIARKFDEIVAFSEVEKFLDTPVKHYSSGMYTRLAFSVAAHLEPEILVVDEVLAVGDAAFQKKCLGKMGDVAGEGRTVLFVSHNMGAVASLCKTGVLLDQGMAKFSGPIQKCIDTYLNNNEAEIVARFSSKNVSNEPIYLEQVYILNSEGKLATELPIDQSFHIHYFFKINQELSKIYTSLHVHDDEMNTVIFARDFESDERRINYSYAPGVYEGDIVIPPLLAPGNYRFSLHFSTSIPPRVIYRADGICPIELVDQSSIRSKLGFPWHGKINAALDWNIYKKGGIGYKP